MWGRVNSKFVLIQKKQSAFTREKPQLKKQQGHGPADFIYGLTYNNVSFP